MYNQQLAKQDSGTTVCLDACSNLSTMQNPKGTTHMLKLRVVPTSKQCLAGSWQAQMHAVQKLHEMHAAPGLESGAAKHGSCTSTAQFCLRKQSETYLAQHCVLLLATRTPNNSANAAVHERCFHAHSNTQTDHGMTCTASSSPCT
jgi:hypothetical protein